MNKGVRYRPRYRCRRATTCSTHRFEFGQPPPAQYRAIIIATSTPATIRDTPHSDAGWALVSEQH